MVRINIGKPNFSKVLTDGVYGFKRIVYGNEIDGLTLIESSVDADDFKRVVFGCGGVPESSSSDVLFLIDNPIVGVSRVKEKTGIIRMVIEVYVFRDYASRAKFNLVNNCLINKN